MADAGANSLIEQTIRDRMTQAHLSLGGTLRALDNLQDAIKGGTGPAPCLVKPTQAPMDVPSPDASIATLAQLLLARAEVVENYATNLRQGL